jgi:hypothetical protein
MKPGRYAAPDGSFARSAGGAGARGLLLLAVALLIGVVLLNATDADPPGTTISARGDSDSGDGGAGTDNGGGDGDAAAATTTTVPATTTLPARAPAEVKVIVANASEVKGAAGGGRTVLANAKYNVLAPANAAASPTSSVFFIPGYDRDAAAIAAALQLPANLVKPMPAPLPFDTKGAHVAVVLGADHAAKFGTAPAAGATTTTAAAGATTTTAAAAATTSTTKKP